MRRGLGAGHADRAPAAHPLGAWNRSESGGICSADTLYVVGGLYGNPSALRTILRRAERESGGPAAVVFNGDFHWLDVDPEDLLAVGGMVLAHHAIKGNVEAELRLRSSAPPG